MHLTGASAKPNQIGFSEASEKLPMLVLNLLKEVFRLAIYHMSGQIISRVGKEGKQRSAVAAAAYRSGDKLKDERDGKTKFYHREVKPVSFILAPEHAPDWVYNRERLWNEVEKVEKQYNSQLAREFNIALPRELSNEQQEKLAREYCQNTFVNDGMVADISIHRDDKNNPHFHVMLTVRPFKENGEWGAKTKKEYIKDKDGNFVLNEKGNKKTRNVSLTGWDKNKEKMNFWRKSWADIANKYLALNGFDSRISHLSNEAQGIEKMPTIHEGYAARSIDKRNGKSERVNHNKNVKSYNKTVEDLNKYKKIKKRNSRNIVFTHNFSPAEKKTLKEAAKFSKMFVSFSSVKERKNQLEKWHNSFKFKPLNEENLKKLNRINKEKELLTNAEKILVSESERFINKHYQNIDLNKLNDYGKIAIVDNTVQNKRLLNESELESVLRTAENEEIENSISSILNNRFRFVDSIEKEIEQLSSVFDKYKNTYNIDFSNKNSLENVPDKAIKQMKIVFDRKKSLTNSLDLMNKLYMNKLNEMYPAWKGKEHLSLKEKELFVMGAEYYGQAITPKDFNNPPRKYSLMEQKEILLLMNTNPSAIHQKYADFDTQNESYKQMFLAECYSYLNEFDEGEKAFIVESMNSTETNNIFKEFNGEKLYSFKKDEVFFSDQTNDSAAAAQTSDLFFNTLESVITDADRRAREDEERLRKKKKQNRNRGMGL